MAPELLAAWHGAGFGQAIVTGSGGYLGSRLAAALAAAGLPVVGVQRRGAAPAGCTVLHADLAEPGVLDPLLAARPSLLLHLASSSSVAASVADPQAEVRHNLGPALHALEALRRHGGRLLLASSISVADPASPLPHAETVRLSPRSPYAACKAAAELFAGAYGACYGVDCRIARIATVYGPGLRRFALHDLLQRLRAQPGRVEIRGSGLQLRDYLQVDDAIDALLRVALLGTPGQVCNVGSGRSIRLDQLAALINARLGQPAPEIVADGQAAPGDIERWALDLTCLQALGFVPRWTLEAGIDALLAAADGEPT